MENILWDVTSGETPPCYVCYTTAASAACKALVSQGSLVSQNLVFYTLVTV